MDNGGSVSTCAGGVCLPPHAIRLLCALWDSGGP